MATHYNNHLSTKASARTVTREEFESFVQHVDGKFQALSTALDRIADKMDRTSQPKYGLLVSVGSLIFFMVSMGATLTWTQMQSMDNLSTARDETIRERLALIVTTIDKVVTQQAIIDTVQESKLSEHIEKNETEMIRTRDQEIQVGKIEERLHWVHQQIEQHAAAADHPWAVIDQLQNLNAEIKAIQSNRFDIERGSALEQRVEDNAQMIEQLLHVLEEKSTKPINQ